MIQNYIGSEEFQVRNGLVVNNNILVVNATSGTVGVNTANSSISLYLNSTDGVQLPTGNSGNRVFTGPGMLRYNTDLNTAEYAGNQNWHPLGNQPFNCGRLRILQPPGTGTVANTLMSFIPYNGNYIKVNGSIYQIPSQGIVANALSCFVNGVGGQNLGNPTPHGNTGSASQYWNGDGSVVNSTNLYYVYVFNNNGTPALDFCSTGHVTSTTPGNVGTEIKAGDDTRTLVGMIWPVPLSSGSTQLGFSNWIFDTQNGYRYQCNLANWFNRQSIGLIYCLSFGYPNDSVWHPWATLYGLLWGDDLTFGIYTQFWLHTGVTTYAATIMPDINSNYQRGRGNFFTDSTSQWEDSVGYADVSVSGHLTDFSGYYMKEGINGFNGYYDSQSTGAPNPIQAAITVNYRA